MSKLEQFLNSSPAGENKPAGVEWFAAVRCQTCGVDVDQQTLYPGERILIWDCPAGHRSYLEDYLAF